MTTTRPASTTPDDAATRSPGVATTSAVLAAATIFLMLVQVASGILLAFYYEPTTEAAHQSVVYLMSRVTGGWLVRSVHHWTAEVLVISVALYLIALFFARSYRGPRRWGWVLGVALLGVTFAFRFTGDLLPYDQEAYITTAAGVRIAGEVPAVGHAVQGIAFGGETISDATLNRFYTGHVLLLPWVAFWLAAGYAALLARARGPGATLDGLVPRGAVLLAGAAASLFLGGVVLASAFWPAAVGEPVTRFDVPAGALPHWNFAGLHGFLGLFPEGSRVAGYGAALACWGSLLSWPFVERVFPERLRDRLSGGVGLLACSTVVAMILSAYRG